MSGFDSFFELAQGMQYKVSGPRMVLLKHPTYHGMTPVSASNKEAFAREIQHVTHLSVVQVPKKNGDGQAGAQSVYLRKQSWEDLENLSFPFTRYKTMKFDVAHLHLFPRLESVSFANVEVSGYCLSSQMKKSLIKRFLFRRCTVSFYFISDLIQLNKKIVLAGCSRMDARLSMMNVNFKHTSCRGLQMLRIYQAHRVEVRDIVSAFPDLVYLDAARSDMASVFGLHRLQQLRYLQLDKSQVTDISALAMCPRLEVLDVTKTQIRTLNVSLPHLQAIEALRCNLLEEFDFSCFPQLKMARIGGENIRRFLCNDAKHLKTLLLSRLPRLEELSICGIPWLEELQLSYLQIPKDAKIENNRNIGQLVLTKLIDLDWSAFQHCTATKLQIDGFAPVNFNFPSVKFFDLMNATFQPEMLSNTPLLDTLSLYKCSPFDVRQLGPLSRLRELFLSYNEIMSLDGLSRYPLEKIDISDCYGIEDYGFLENLPLLETLEICDMPGFEIQRLQNSPRLKRFIYDNKLKNIDFLSRFTELRYLDIEVDPSVVLNCEFAAFKHLTELRIEGQLGNLLSRTPNLLVLTIYEQQVVDFSGQIETLKKLLKLKISYQDVKQELIDKLKEIQQKCGFECTKLKNENKHLLYWKRLAFPDQETLRDQILAVEKPGHNCINTFKTPENIQLKTARKLAEIAETQLRALRCFQAACAVAAQ